MNDKKEQVSQDNQSTEASTATKGCMIGAIFGIILFIAALITAVIVLVLTLFSDDNTFGNWDFGFIDDVNGFLSEEFNEGIADGNTISATVAGLHIVVNDYYYEDIGMHEISDEGSEAFIIDVTIANEERETYALTPSAFHLEIDGENAYPYYDGSMRVNGEGANTGDYRDYMVKGDAERYLIVFEVSPYIDFNQDKTLVFSHYFDDEEASFDLPH